MGGRDIEKEGHVLYEFHDIPFAMFPIIIRATPLNASSPNCLFKRVKILLSPCAACTILSDV